MSDCSSARPYDLVLHGARGFVGKQPSYLNKAALMNQILEESGDST
jgi:hypothetical protein